MHLLFLHGFLGNRTDWDEVMQQLPFDCSAVDLPGHGEAPFSSDLKALLPTFPVHLVGYSMGGRIALQLAEKYPEKILSLTLLSAHLGLKEAEEKKKRLQKDQALSKEILESPIDQFLSRWYDQPLFRTLTLRRDLKKMRQKQNQVGLAQALSAFSLGLQENYSDRLPPLTHLLVGEFDEAYRSHYQNLPHTVIPNAGHAIHLEEPKAVADYLKRNIR